MRRVIRPTVGTSDSRPPAALTSQVLRRLPTLCPHSLRLALSSAFAHGFPADLWLIDADGTALRRLTSVGEDMPTPAWLPDSSGLVFQGLHGIYLYQLSTGQLQFIDDQGWHAGLGRRSSIAPRFDQRLAIPRRFKI